MYDDMYKTPIIQTERLILRPIQQGDYNDFIEYFTDETVSDLLGGYRNPIDLQNAKLLFEEKCRAPFTWAIELAQSGKVIGDVHFHNIVTMYLAEIGYMTNKHFRHNGYATEAVTALVDYCFSTLPFGRIRAKVLLQNASSINLLKRCGFKEEALIYEDNYGGKVGNVFYFSISNCELS